MWAVWITALAAVADFFDRLYQRHAVRVSEYELAPPFKLFQYGTIGDGKFFCLRTWAHSYEFCPQWADYRWCRGTLVWTSRRGWRVHWEPVAE